VLPPRIPLTPSPPQVRSAVGRLRHHGESVLPEVEIRRSTRHMQRLALLTALFVVGPDLPTGPASMDIPTSAALLCRLERSRFEFGTLLSRRYLLASRDWVPKSAHWMTFVLVHLPSKNWKIFMRVER